jgi:hypothetical protein
MAATAATPLAAQDNGWRGRNHDGGEQRSQSVEQRQQARQERQEARQQRQESQQQVQQVQQQQVQAQQQEQVRAERYQGRNRGNWGGDRQQDNASRFAAEREASRRSAEETIGGSFARQAAENERRYEQQTLRREQRDNRGWNGNRDGNRGSWNGNRDGNRNWSGNRNGGHDWNRNWRSDNRYDWQRYRYQNRRIFSPGRYYAPYGGYGYSRLNIGIVLGDLFFGRNYWIDPYYYHLPPAPPGTQWVRYYNDVVLVDIYTGEVVDVIYDFFW